MSKRLVGPLVFLAGMVSSLAIGEPLALDGDLTWRNVVALCAIPLLCGYAGYHMGWINGHYAGWIKARDEYRPNAEHEPRRGTSRSAPCSCSARGYWFRCKCGQAVCNNCGKHYDDTPKGVVGNVQPL